MPTIIKGFSKLSREEKIKRLQENHQLPDDFAQILKTYRHPEKQDLFDDFSENTLSNFYLPFGVAPNFLINDSMYAIPMVVEESSVVAAASRAAAFWANQGGFRTTIHNTRKKGHIWFEWNGPASLLNPMPDHLKLVLKEAVAPITENMEKRGGGIRKMTIEPLDEKPNVFQLSISFETRDSMGANFINSCLEEMKQPFLDYFTGNKELAAFEKPDVLMAILSNYTTECLATTKVECPVKELSPLSAGMDPEKFAHRFKTAVDIAASDTSRAVTHNKGIFNGTDAVVIATGNDFRAAEAAGHAWAARHGKYQSLSHCHISEDNIFSMELTIPLALGTVGGLTRLHPMASLALEMLGNPTAPELMGIAASAGLANNFSAVASLVTTGIQKGHMKLHLTNLLQSLGATSREKEAALAHFQHKTVSA
ncbi:MAG: hydroxymethylglutaryl-CoA reductase, partial [Marinilabiliaceae bacterium]